MTVNPTTHPGLLLQLYKRMSKCRCWLFKPVNITVNISSEREPMLWLILAVPVDFSVSHQIRIMILSPMLFGAWCLLMKNAIVGSAVQHNFTTLWNVPLDISWPPAGGCFPMQTEHALSCHVLYVPEHSLWLISRTFSMSHRAAAPGISTPLGGLRLLALHECQHGSENCIMWPQTRSYI